VGCASCGHTIAPGAGFCEACGAAADLGTHRTTPGERKQVTVMFVDIVGSMDLTEALDSEHWRALLDRFYAIVSDAVNRVGGTIDKFTGDGAMALFGAPVAHEDHARRACLAALHMQVAVTSFAHELAADGVALAIRVGLNSGEVIVGEVGDGGRMDYTAVGHTVALAARMEPLAPPGSTALSAATGALVAGEFAVRELGEFDVKGSSVPLRVLELVGKASSRDRVEAAGARGGLSLFVGREYEQSILDAALRRALEGDGQVIGLVGEPGVGKSRLAHEFTERCAAAGMWVGRTRAVAHGREVPLLPILELMRTSLGVSESDHPPTARRRIARSLELLDVSFEEDLPLLFDFLGVGDPDRPVLKFDPDARQRQMLSVIRRVAHARSRLRPTVTLVEDLHWLDDASAVLLAELVRASAGSRTLLILTYRPEYPADGLGDSHCQRITLRPLEEGAVGELLGSLLGGHRSLDKLADLIAARAVGNPFFCEELVQALAESGHLIGALGSYRLQRTLEEVVLPATVQATLAARIDRLGEREKELLQVASVVGYELEEPVLGAVAGLSSDQLSEALDALVRSELLYAHVSSSGVEYAFKHPLTQEVAYRSQLSERRRSVHDHVARAIERLYPARLDELAALVAQHSEAAGNQLAAARWSARAADWVGLSDISQALAHWRKVSALVDTLAVVPETTALSLLAHIRQLDYGWRLGITEQEATAHYEAGRELAERSGDRINLLLITATYANAVGLSGHTDEYGVLCEEVNRLGIEIADPALRLATIPMSVYSRFVLGRLSEALESAEEAIALGAEDPGLGGGIVLVCPYAFCLYWRGVIHGFMGELEQSAAELDRALQVAREQGDLETEGWVRGWIGWLARYTGPTEIALEHARTGDEIAERIGSAYSRVWSLTFLGDAHLTLGEPREAIGALERAIDLGRDARTGLELDAWRTGALAEALLGAGEHPRAIEAAKASVELALRRGNEAVLPMSYRVLADVLLACERPGNGAEARAALEKAIAAVEATGARAEMPLIENATQQLMSAS
jgi:class 3 adenylate cyclase/tetratricopeptide (TPR) repeat protein